VSKQRIVAGLAAVAICTAGATALIPRAAGASALCDSATATTVSPQNGAPGQSVTVIGSGFTNGAQNCNVTVSVGAKTVTGTVASDSQLTFAAVDGMFGEVKVTVSPPVGPGSFTASSHRNFYITPTVSSVSTTTPTEQQAMTASGARFQLGGLLSSASATFVSGTSQCQTQLATAGSDATLSFSAPSTYCSGPLQLTFNAPGGTGNPSNIAMTVVAGSVTVVPSVSSFPGAAPAGTRFTVSGSGFSSAGSLTGGTWSLVQWTDSSIVVNVPVDAESAPLTLTRSDGAVVHSGQLIVPVTVGGLTPSSVVVGNTVTVNGSGFGPAAQPGSVSLGATTVKATWSPTSITFTVPHGVASGTVRVTRSDSAVAAATPTLTVLPQITGITPTHATQGSLVEIIGTSFGTQQGTVSVGGKAANVTLWGDEQVLVTLPDVPPGNATVTVTVPGAPSTLSIGIAIDPGATPSPGATPAPLITPNPSGPIVSPGASIPFEKPKPPAGPVALSLSTPSDNAAPGSDVSFTVTLAAFGKPLVGAPVDLIMVVEPGTDASITPAKGVTDANGTLTGTIHLSKTAGDHIVLARSGQYSDETRVVGRVAGSDGAVAGAGAGNSGGAGMLSSQRLLIVGALVICLVLFLTGFAIQLKAQGGVGRRRRVERPQPEPPQ
jgi:hypothetical protein